MPAPTEVITSAGTNAQYIVFFIYIFFFTKSERKWTIINNHSLIIINSQVCTLNPDVGRCRGYSISWKYRPGLYIPVFIKKIKNILWRTKEKKNHALIIITSQVCTLNPDADTSRGQNSSCFLACTFIRLRESKLKTMLSIIVDSQVCTLNPDAGTCRGYNISWYYDSTVERCQRFVWTGCEGNGNRFSTEDECIGYCGPSVDTVVTPAPTQSTGGKSGGLFHLHGHFALLGCLGKEGCSLLGAWGTGWALTCFRPQERESKRRSIEVSYFFILTAVLLLLFTTVRAVIVRFLVVDNGANYTTVRIEKLDTSIDRRSDVTYQSAFQLKYPTSLFLLQYYYYCSLQCEILYC